MTDIKKSGIPLSKRLILDKWFREERGKDRDTGSLTQEELIERIRKTRDGLLEEKYKKWFDGTA